MKNRYLMYFIIAGLLLGNFLSVTIHAETYENQYGKLEVYPDTATGLVRQIQYVNVTPYFSNDIDVCFKFDYPLVKSDIFLKKIGERFISNPIYQYNNYTLPNGTIIVNYTLVGYNNYTEYFNYWDSIKNKFEMKFYLDVVYYVAKDIAMIKNKKYELKFVYDVPKGSNGKWDLYIKRNSDTLQKAISTGLYVHIDPWWNSTFYNFRKIIVNHSYVNTNLKNFPVLVILDNSTGDYNFHGNGKDIRFISTDNTTEFYYEIDEFNNTGKSYIWVNITETIPYNLDYEFLVYYNSTVADYNENPNLLFGDEFIAVWHLKDYTTTTVKDSSGNGYTGTKTGIDNPIEKNCIIGYGQEFVTSDQIDFNDINPIDGETSISFECWFNVDYYGTTTYDILFSKASSTVGDRFMISVRDIGTKNRMLIALSNDATNRYWYNDDIPELQNPDEWHHLFFVFNSGSQNTYIDGVLTTGANWKSSGSPPSNSFDTNSADFLIGYAIGQDYFDGFLDELRVYDITKNVSWVNFSFHIQNQSTNIIFIGSEYISEYAYHPFIYGLASNWKMVSIPYNNTISKYDVFCINATSIKKTWNNSISSGWILEYLFLYNGSSYDTTNNFVPYNGYWLYNYENVSLYYPIPSSNGTYDCNLSGDFLYIAGFEITPETFLILVWLVVFFMWFSSENEAVSDFLALMFAPLTIALLIAVVFPYLTELNNTIVTSIVTIIFIGFAAFPLAWSIDERRKKK